jgi:hypothetical protein
MTCNLGSSTLDKTARFKKATLVRHNGSVDATYLGCSGSRGAMSYRPKQRVIRPPKTFIVFAKLSGSVPLLGNVILSSAK